MRWEDEEGMKEDDMKCFKKEIIFYYFISIFFFLQYKNRNIFI